MLPASRTWAGDVTGPISAAIRLLRAHGYQVVPPKPIQPPFPLRIVHHDHSEGYRVDAYLCGRLLRPMTYTQALAFGDRLAVLETYDT